jgi:predicted lipase
VTSITTTGHSLGGALASLSAFSLHTDKVRLAVYPECLPVLVSVCLSRRFPLLAGERRAGRRPLAIAVCGVAPQVNINTNGDVIPITSFTFEAPRVGNQAYADTFEGNPHIKMLRIVNKPDVVPMVMFSNSKTSTSFSFEKKK